MSTQVFLNGKWVCHDCGHYNSHEFDDCGECGLDRERSFELCASTLLGDLDLASMKVNELKEKLQAAEKENKILREAVKRWKNYSDGVAYDKKGNHLSEKDVYDLTIEALTEIEKREGMK